MAPAIVIERSRRGQLIFNINLMRTADMLKCVYYSLHCVL